MKPFYAIVACALVLAVSGCSGTSSVDGWDVPKPKGTDEQFDTKVDGGKSSLLTSPKADLESAENWISELEDAGYTVLSQQKHDDYLFVTLTKGDSVATVEVDKGNTYMLTKVS